MPCVPFNPSPKGCRFMPMLAPLEMALYPDVIPELWGAAPSPQQIAWADEWLAANGLADLIPDRTPPTPTP